MHYLLFPLLLVISLVGQSSNSAAAISGNTTLYPIDSSQRGADIINLFTTLYNKSVPSGNVYEVAIQTRYNGLLTWVQSVSGTTNNTLLIVKWGPTIQTVSQTAPAVIPAEQVVEVLYSVGSQTIPPNATFGASHAPGTLPYFSLDPGKRAADILAIYNYFINTVKPSTLFQYMTITTTLSGIAPPYLNTSSSFNGIINYVQSLTLTPNSSTGPFLRVTYKQNKTSANITIDVAAEYVTGISFSVN